MAVRYKKLLVVSDRRVDSLTVAGIRERFPGYKRKPGKYTKTFFLMEGEEMQEMVRTNIIMTQCDAFVNGDPETFRDEMFRDMIHYLSKSIKENVTTNYKVANSFNFKLHIYVRTDHGLDLKWWKDNVLYMEWEEPEITSVSQLGVPYSYDMTRFTLVFRFKEGMFMVKRDKPKTAAAQTPLQLSKDHFMIKPTLDQKPATPAKESSFAPPAKKEAEYNTPEKESAKPRSSEPKMPNSDRFGYIPTKRSESETGNRFGYPREEEPPKRFGNVPTTFGGTKSFIPEKGSGFNPNFSASVDKFLNTGSSNTVGNFGRWAANGKKS